MVSHGCSQSVMVFVVVRDGDALYVRAALLLVTSIQVSMTKIRQRLSSKHQEIAERLSAMLSKSVKDQAQVSKKNCIGSKGRIVVKHLATLVGHENYPSYPCFRLASQTKHCFRAKRELEIPR